MTYRATYQPKDWQRSKVYAAENAAFLSDRPFFKSNEDVQVFVDKMIKSAWFQRRFKSTRSIRVLRNHGGTRAYGNHNGGAAYIKLPSSDWGRSWPVVLHEIGHAVTPRYTRGVLVPRLGTGTALGPWPLRGLPGRVRTVWPGPRHVLDSRTRPRQ